MPKDFKVQLAEIIRDSVHNLVINESTELDNEIYFTKLKSFIEALEGSRSDAYLDGILDPDKPSQFISVAKFNALDESVQDQLKKECLAKRGKGPVTTVGIGANIDKKEVQNHFDAILGTPGLMQQVSLGKENLTDEQISLIFRDCIKTRLNELHTAYGDDWDKLRLNERITIISLYFNNPKLAGGQTNFRRYIRNYAETDNPVYLQQAVREVTDKSNATKSPGIQNRRNAEGALLASYEVPAYTKPSETPDSAKVKIADINSTIIPFNNDHPVYNTNSEYFIWRTRLDSRVRAAHLMLEGKVFRKDDPPKGYMPAETYNCRCIAEEVPDYILVKDEIAKSRAFSLYLRKGTQHPILFI